MCGPESKTSTCTCDNCGIRPVVYRNISVQILDWKTPNKCHCAQAHPPPRNTHTHHHYHRTLTMIFFSGYYIPGCGLSQAAELVSDHDRTLRVSNWWTESSLTHSRLVNDILITLITLLDIIATAIRIHGLVTWLRVTLLSPQNENIQGIFLLGSNYTL